MTKLKTVIRNQKDQKNSDGKYNVKIRLTHKGIVRFISTNFYVTEKQILNGEIINHEKAKQYNIELRKTLNDYDRVIIDLGQGIRSMDVDSVLRQLRSTEAKKTANFYDFASKVISDLKLQGRLGYYNSIETTIRQMKLFAYPQFLSFENLTEEYLEKFSHWYLAQVIETFKRNTYSTMQKF
jgi:hypothetical protein